VLLGGLTAHLGGCDGLAQKPVLTSLREPDGGDRPLAMMALDRDSQAVQFVKPNVVHCPSLSIGENDGLGEKFILGSLVFIQDRRCADVHNWHGIPRLEVEPLILALKTRTSRGRHAANA
jgi:hypothetical protein